MEHTVKYQYAANRASMVIVQEATPVPARMAGAVNGVIRRYVPQIILILVALPSIVQDGGPAMTRVSMRIAPQRTSKV